MSIDQQLYQQVILEHNKHPRNYGPLTHATHCAEGYNPLCGDHYHLYLKINDQGFVEDVHFEGQGCAISKASASMMTEKLKGLNQDEALQIVEEFHQLVTHKLDPETQEHHLGKLKIFSGIWKYPARVKCAVLPWHTFKGALKNETRVSTEA